MGAVDVRLDEVPEDVLAADDPLRALLARLERAGLVVRCYQSASGVWNAAVPALGRLSPMAGERVELGRDGYAARAMELEMLAGLVALPGPVRPRLAAIGREGADEATAGGAGMGDAAVRAALN